MPTNRFYSPSLQSPVVLENEEHHHLSRVMRVSEGESVELVDGKGHLAIAKVQEIGKKKTVLHLESVKHFPPLAPTISLAVPLMLPSKLEWVVEKGTELGADAFLFYRADRSKKEELSIKQIERMRSLSIAAMKQSGRLYLPEFEVLVGIDALFSKTEVLMYGDTDPNAKWIRPVEEPMVFITGPEGGFSERELDLLKKKATGMKINPNVLRAETAPIAALSILKITYRQTK